MPVKSLYIHIPFCIRKCLYCDFFSIPFDQSITEEYIHALLIEIDIRSKDLYELKTIYIGGGTPTVVTVQEFEKLFKGLKGIPWSKDIEITIEANPSTISREKIRSLMDQGVNRFSLGIQSFIDSDLEVLGRIHTSLEGMRAIEVMKKEGIKNLSVDLIYGIPGQSMKEWQFNLSKTIEYHPEHLSTYELTTERETPIYDLIAKGGLKKPDDDTILNMYYRAIEDLTSAGYVHYEISNFAIRGFQCRHNLNYWDRGEYIGVGAGAHSFEDNKRKVNIRDVRRYIDALKGGSLLFEEVIEVTPEEALKEQIFLGLRKTDGISRNLLKERFQIDVIPDLFDFEREGLLKISDDHIRLTKKGIIVSNSLIVKLFEILGL